MNIEELIAEAFKAFIWMAIGAFPLAVGVLVHMWADIRSLKKAINASFKKIRALEGDAENVKGRD